MTDIIVDQPNLILKVEAEDQTVLLNQTQPAILSFEVVGVQGPPGSGGGVSDGDKGDITVSGSGATWTIDAGAVTLSKMADLATSTILGRVTAGTGVTEALTASQVRTLLNVADGATANASDAALRDRATHTGAQLASTISDFASAVAATAAVTANTAKVTNATHTGDVTGATALTIAADVVTNAKLANMATATIKGRATAGIGDPEDLTGAEVAGILPLATATVAGLAKIEPGPTRYFAWDDCENGTNNIANGPWLTANNGTGASLASVNNASGGAGWLRFDTGTTAAGRASRTIGANTIDFGNGVATFRALDRVNTLSNGTNTYTIRCGFIDSVTGESVDGAFFRYTHAVNGGRFEAVCRSNNVETGSVADTGITVAVSTNYLFEIEVDASIPQAVFKINGATVATITTNIPTGDTRATGAGHMALKSAGTGATSTWLVDYQSAEQILAGRS